MKVTLTQQDVVHFEVANDRGQTVELDGPPKIGGSDAAMRPMELFLASLGGCAAMDVVHILNRQRQKLTALRIVAEGRRADAVPAVYEAIHLRFEAEGEVDRKKLDRAVTLSVEQYCSVRSMLKDDIEVTHSATLNGE